MSLMSLFSALQNPLGGLREMLTHPSPQPVVPPEQGGFNAPGFHTFGPMQTGQQPAPQADGHHPGGFEGFMKQQLASALSGGAPAGMAPDMSAPTSYQNVGGGVGAPGGEPQPGFRPFRPFGGFNG